MSKFLPVLAAILAGAVLSLAGAAIGARVIENTSAKAVENQFTLKGFEWAQVQGDGLQIVLTGVAPDEQAQLSAQRAAGHVVDPARVMNVMSVVQKEAIPAPRFSIEILRNDSGISLIGLVPTSWDRDGFVERLKKASGTGSVADLLEQADYDAPAGWSRVTRFGLSAIALLPRSKISLAADGITVTALADSAEQKAEFENDLADEFPDGIDTKVEIAAPRPVITPFTMRFVIDENGARFDACTAETETGRARILAAARAADIQDPTCTIGLGAPSADWANAVETGMRALQDLGQGSLTFSDGEVTLIAQEGTSASVFDSVVGELEADLPDTFTVHATLPETVDLSDSDTQPEFIALRSPEGQTQLRGRIADARSERAIDALARAEFGAHSVYSAMRVDPNGLPSGWSMRAMASVEALSHLTHGSVTMTAEDLVLIGVTEEQNAKSEIAGIFSQKLGTEARYTLDVTYVAPPEPDEIKLSAEDCVTRANDVIAGSKIVFDPGSVELNTAANATLDAVAEALKDCEEVDMEIGAHSDSQGGETMNLNLSTARANSVLDGLLARRVAGVKFTAQGYGESQPIADNGTEEGREANRRIEFKLLGAQTAPTSDEAAQTTEATADDTQPENDDASTTSDTTETNDTAAEQQDAPQADGGTE